MGGLSAIMLGLTKYDQIKSEVKCIISEAPWLSKCPQRDPGFIEHAGIKLLSFENSPLFSTYITARLFLNVEECQKYSRENKLNWPQNLPLLYQQGTGDNMVDPALNHEWIQELIENKDKLNIDVVYKSYENYPHYLLKAQSRPQAAKDILEFIDQHI